MTDVITYLLVEDEKDQSDILSKWLKAVAKKGEVPVEIEIIVENNLEAGLAASVARQPNATFLDILVPLKAGEPPIPAEQWRTAANFINQFVPPVIVTTGMAITPELLLYCKERGAHRVFHKPFDYGFFSKLKTDTKLFAAQLLSAAASAELSNALHATGNGKPYGQQGEP